jgi:hypothetical protein
LLNKPHDRRCPVLTCHFITNSESCLPLQLCVGPPTELSTDRTDHPSLLACHALWSSEWLPTLPSSKVKQSDWPLKLKAPRSFETSTTTHPHGVTSQKTWILSHAAVITSNVALRKAFFIWKHIPRTLKKYPKAYTKREDADGMTTQLASASSNIAVQTQLAAKLGTFQTTPRKFTGSMNASALTPVWCCRTIDVASICAFQSLQRQLTQSRYENCFVRPLQASWLVPHANTRSGPINAAVNASHYFPADPPPCFSTAIPDLCPNPKPEVI